jgi:hypothetical protein
LLSLAVSPPVSILQHCSGGDSKRALKSSVTQSSYLHDI